MIAIPRGAAVETEYGFGVVRFQVAGLDDQYWVDFQNGEPGRIFPGHQLVIVTEENGKGEEHGGNVQELR